METYKSTINVLNDTFKQLSQSKLVGEFSWMLQPNTSGKQLVKFPAPYARKPILHVVISCDSGSELECRHTIAKFTNESFEVHILNSDMVNQMAGTCIWSTLPSN